MSNPATFVFLQHDVYSTALFGIAVVFVTAWIFGALAHRIGQPRVIGEIVAGLVLGPSVLGSLSTHLFPTAERPTLGVLAQLGVSIFMFLVGLEIDFPGLRRRGHHRVASAVTLSGIAVPFALGIGLALILFPTHHGPKLSVFCLFLGVSLSITAFPVLARIISERELSKTPLGNLAMLVAAGSDVLTWAVLIAVLTFAISGSALQIAYFLILALAFAVVMAFPVRHMLATFSDRTYTNGALLPVLAGILACATFTAVIGFHELFGAFMLGAIFPRGSFSVRVAAAIQPIARMFLPIFFVSTGLLVDVHQLGPDGAWQLTLVVVAACLGKIGGVGLGARLAGLKARDATGLGVLMNTRGLTELIVLTIGLQAHILDHALFSIFVVMSVVTTVMTGPLLTVTRPDPSLGGHSEDREEGGSGIGEDIPV
jgi:Kef-type K+ transport system membrane component KefB